MMPAEKRRTKRKGAPDRRMELSLDGLVCGVDEVGYSPLAGPVLAAAVILGRGPRPRALAGMRDSKQHSRAQRERFHDVIVKIADVGIGAASVAEIDSRNIYQANRLAMARAVGALDAVPAIALVDGNFKPDLPCAFKNVVKGDETCLCIAAASIVAKVTRDRMMEAWSREHPVYGWESNAGYGTETHLLGLLQHGPTALHRRSFAPLRTWLAESAVPPAFRFEPIDAPRPFGQLFALRNGMFAVLDDVQRHVGVLALGAGGWRFRAMAYGQAGREQAQAGRERIVAAGPFAQIHNMTVPEPSLDALRALVHGNAR